SVCTCPRYSGCWFGCTPTPRGGGSEAHPPLPPPPSGCMPCGPSPTHLLRAVPLLLHADHLAEGRCRAVRSQSDPLPDPPGHCHRALQLSPERDAVQPLVAEQPVGERRRYCDSARHRDDRGLRSGAPALPRRRELRPRGLHHLPGTAEPPVPTAFPGGERSRPHRLHRGPDDDIPYLPGAVLHLAPHGVFPHDP